MSSNRKGRQPPLMIEATLDSSSTHDGQDVVFGQDDNNSSSQSNASDKDDTVKGQESSNSQKTIGSGGYGSGLLDYRKNGKVISTSRIIFFITFGISAILTATLTYYFLRGSESFQFEKQFKAHANEIRMYTQHNIDSVFSTLKGLSTSTTSVVKKQTSEGQWPPGFIGVPDIQYNMGLARNLSKALVLAYMPKVLKGDYDKWTNYSMTHKDWIAEAQPGGPLDLEPIIRPYIWEFTDYEWEDIDGDDASLYNMELSQEPPNRTRQLSNDNLVTRSLRGLQSTKIEEQFHDCTGKQSRRRRNLADETDSGSDSSKISQAPLDDEYQTPVWQLFPIPTIDNESPEVQIINYNLLDRDVFFKAAEYMEKSRAPVFLDVCDQAAWFLINEHRDVVQTVVAFPVFADFTPTAPIIGFFTAIIPWEEFFVNSLGYSKQDMVVVMTNTCGETFSVSITSDGGAEIIGEYDDHDPAYDDMKIEFPFAQDYNRQDFADIQGDICLYSMAIYPTKQFQNASMSYQPLWVCLAIILIFLLTSCAFILYDFVVTKRQNRLVNTAMRQNALVNSLFPKNIQQKLIEDMEEKELDATRRNLTTFLHNDQRSRSKTMDHPDSKPIADLFPNTTIMFADIAGFTSWSSAREPEAVFTLLETIYQAFDEIAKRHRVFKVEVVGDCYVAVCGLPDPRKDHYAVMCRFAQDCVAAMNVHTKELELRLGPDTGDLALRVGLHSGPVVAGVLRGDKSRFQLFGDTMNTASRMESTGVPNRIQLSQATADLLILNGKEHWIAKRQDKVKAKGKGELTTYFLLTVKKRSSFTISPATSKVEEVLLVRPTKQSGAKSVEKRNRVADWVVEMLGKLLKEMKAKRQLTGKQPDSMATIQELEYGSIGAATSEFTNETVIDEVAEYLKLPSFYKGGNSGISHVSLDEEVIDELKHYVYSIATLYKKNPFHNFEHASHVSMSCIKLLNRIASYDEENLDSSNHHTYGICSDPLTSFAIVFSALIHDVDHTGVPNAQLVKEEAEVATIYKNKSVAEQNSIDIGWGLLMEPKYVNLRRHIYTTVAEYKCFRQIVVNCIMATDICDRDLIQARNKRWDLAFSPEAGLKSDGDHARLTGYRKATVVIEHLIQLSDVCHTMQHWHMYRRWNERLFEEGYKAYVEGRAEKDPSVNWYKGELGFYDFYIIPLAKKIKQCAVFGVSSDEFLSYALSNRKEWEERGHEVVKDMIAKVNAVYNGGNSEHTEGRGTPRMGNGSSNNPKPKDRGADDDGEGSSSVYSEGHGSDSDENISVPSFDI